MLFAMLSVAIACTAGMSLCSCCCQRAVSSLLR